MTEQTIKNYKEAKEKIKILIQTKNDDKSKKALIQKQTSETALQEMRELLENYQKRLNKHHNIEDPDLEDDIKKINEVLRE